MVLSAKFVNSMRFGTLNSTPIHAISIIYEVWGMPNSLLHTPLLFSK